ncbi:MAG: hypothetical protein ACRDIY_23400, partial [Chloroflexota bacterium]
HVRWRGGEGVRPPWPLLATVLLGFALNCLAIQGINLGLDGGLSLALGVIPLPDALRFLAHDVHPPLYYVALRGWLAIVGAQPFAVKFLGLGFATFSVAALAAWIRRFAGIRAACQGSLLLALSPLLIGDAATVRDLAPWLCFVILGGWSYCEARREPAPARWTYLYLASGVLAIWTSFLAVGALLGQAVHLLIRPRKGRLIGPLLVIGLSIVPWLGFALAQGWLATITSGGPTGGGAEPSLFADLRGAVSLLLTGSDSTRLAILGVAVAIVAFAAAPALRGISRDRLAEFALVETLVTFGFALAVTSTWLKLGVPSRYLATALPTWLLLVVVLAGRAGRWRSWLAVVALVVVSLTGLLSWYRQPTLPAAFWNPRGVQEFLDRRLAANDRVVFLTLEQAGYYQALSPRPHRWTAIPVGTGYLERDARANAERSLSPLLSSDRAIWLVEYHGVLGPGQRDVDGWLAAHAYPLPPIGLSDSDAHPFLSGASLGPDRPLAARFADDVWLDAVAFPEGAQSGSAIPVRLTWRASHPLSRDLTVFVHLVDQRGQTVAQQDAKPVDGLDPTLNWRGTVVDRHGLVIPPTAAPGEAWIEVGLYDTAGRLPVVGRDDGTVRLGPIRISSSL